MEDYQIIFTKDPYTRVSPLFNIITVFDDIHYSGNDYEMLSPPQRNHVLEKLKAHDHKQVTGKTLKGLSTNRIVRFAPTASQGVSPLHEFEKHYNCEEFFVTTPGTYFLFLFRKLFEDQSSTELNDEIENLIQTHPVNLDQLYFFSEKDEFHLLLKGKLSHLKKLQKEAVEGPLKNRKALGKLL